MGLTVWDTKDDDFDFAQLEANWKAIDTHDHSLGNGVQINTAGLANGSVTTGKLANQAVGNAQIAANAIATAQVQDGAITNAKLAGGIVHGTAIPDGAVTYPMLEATVLPLGTVIMWWRAAGSNATPGGGWEICDGRPWSGITNALGLSTGNIPNLVNGFARGSSMANIGVAGGSATVNTAHAHSVNNHAHVMPQHWHGIANDGAHYHTVANGKQLWARINAFDDGLTVVDYGGVQRRNHFQSLFIPNFLEGGPEAQKPVPNNGMDPVPPHQHGGLTTVSNLFSTGNATATTDTQGSAQSIIPPNVTFAFIMRVR